MRTEGKISKVAICEKCQKYILACHIDFLDKKTEKQFTELTNDGFTVKIETGDETKARRFTNIKNCLKDCCS